LRSEPQPLGDGAVHRAIRAAFGSYFRPPKADHPRSTVRSRRRVGEPIACLPAHQLKSVLRF
jgi:hypothetical protein